MVNLTDQRGFIFSGLSLLLIFSVMILVSAFLASLKEGSEGVGLQVLGREVVFIGEDIKYNLTRLQQAGYVVSELLENIEENYRASGLLVSLENEGGIVRICVKDLNSSAVYEGRWP